MLRRLTVLCACLVTVQGEGMFFGRDIPWESLTTEDGAMLKKSDWDRIQYAPVDQKRAISPALFAMINPDALGKIKDCSFFSVEQYQAIPVKSREDLTPMCRKTLPQYLRTASYGSNEQMQALADLGGGMQGERITEAMCAGFTGSEVTAIGNGCSRLSAGCVAALDQSVWPQMTRACLGSMATDALRVLGWRRLGLIPADELSAAFTIPEQISAVGPAFCSVLDKKSAPRLTPALCAGFSSKCVRLIDRNLAKELSGECIGHFTPEAISAFNGQQVSGISPKAFLAFTSEQMGAFSPSVCASFSPGQMAALKLDACGAMDVGCFQALDKRARTKVSSVCADQVNNRQHDAEVTVISRMATRRLAAPSKDNTSRLLIWGLVPLACFAGVWVGRRRSSESDGYQPMV